MIIAAILVGGAVCIATIVGIATVRCDRIKYEHERDLLLLKQGHELELKQLARGTTP